MWRVSTAALLLLTLVASAPSHGAHAVASEATEPDGSAADAEMLPDLEGEGDESEEPATVEIEIEIEGDDDEAELTDAELDAILSAADAPADTPADAEPAAAADPAPEEAEEMPGLIVEQGVLHVSAKNGIWGYFPSARRPPGRPRHPAHRFPRQCLCGDARPRRWDAMLTRGFG